jgi:predicted amidohydrolase
VARYVGVAGIQFDVLLGQDNTQVMLDKLDLCRRLFPWVELICFSELSVCGLDETLAQPIPNASTRRLCEWAEEHRKWIIPGSMYEKEDSKIYNTAVAISPKGQIAAKYRKIFPWVPVETSAPGGQFCVFDIPGKGRVGLCVCYDQWFPEVIDLERVTHVREYGTLGLSQVWKNFADSPIMFPVYGERFREGEIFKSLGKFRKHEKIE